MAAARQKEIKDSMTVVATTTLTVAERGSDCTEKNTRVIRVIRVIRGQNVPLPNRVRLPPNDQDEP